MNANVSITKFFRFKLALVQVYMDNRNRYQASCEIITVAKPYDLRYLMVRHQITAYHQFTRKPCMLQDIRAFFLKNFIKSINHPIIFLKSRTAFFLFFGAVFQLFRPVPFAVFLVHQNCFQLVPKLFHLFPIYLIYPYIQSLI